MRFLTRTLLLGALATCLVASGAQAAIVASGSQMFTDDAGFFVGVKSFTVYTSDDGANPQPGPAGSFTYVYTITNNPGSFVGLIGFNIEVAEGSVTAADIGFIDTVGNPTPSAATFSTTSAVPGFDTVSFDWGTGDLIDPGDTSDELYIISTYSPGTLNDNIFSINGDFASDETSSCTGPLTPPSADGDPEPCTIGFWKNRYDGKKGTTKWFPNGEFDQVVAAALVLSGGVFTSADANGDCGVLGFADLLCALESKGKRTIEERGRQQLAATLLNLAAGDLFPDNTKCKLFEGNNIGSNACGDGITVGTAVGQALIGIVGDVEAQHEAHECSDDLNNGISVTP